MRRGIVAHPEYLDKSNAEKHLKDADFVFVCIDDGKAKAVIIRKLEGLARPLLMSAWG